MKKIYLSFAAIFSVFVAEAQLTQANNAPANGDTYQMYQCDSVDAGPGGAAMTWSYAVATHSSILNTYSATTINSPSYPNADVNVSSGTVSSIYYGSTTSALNYYGGNIAVGSVAASLNYTSPAIYASYPMAYNTSVTTSIGGSINVTSPLPASGTFTGTSTSTCDGSGTVSVAGMTFTNVLRVKVVQAISFTTNLANGTLDRVTVQYFDNGRKEPVMSIETSTATIPSLFAAPSQTLTQRIKATPTSTTGSTVGMAGIEADANVLSVFPNPANTELTVFCTNKLADQVKVFDLTGKQIAAVPFSAVWAKVNTADYAKGLYIYRVEAANGAVLHSGKITVVH